MTDNERYLRLGGWLQGDSGWWHPPSCLASWPEHEAVEIAKRDEARGLRMTENELRAGLADTRDPNAYIRLCKGGTP